MKDVIKEIRQEMAGKFILLYESTDGYYKFALGDINPNEKDMARLIEIANTIFVKAERQEIGNEILENTVKNSN